jgi:lysophospholipase L1-like esterase
MFWDTHHPLPEEVTAFLDRYAVRQVRMTTNPRGERTTLPDGGGSPITLVAGDSVALGAMVGDGETLASALQARDSTRRFVNIGVGGADAWDIRCALERAERDHGGALDALVYVYCENDLDPEERMGTPDKVIAFLRELAERNGLKQVIVVYAPYVYNIVPELTRIRGERGGRFPDRAAERETLAQLVAEAGFGWIDIGALALDEARRAGTRLAALALFTDLVHLSPAGAALLGAAVHERLAR